MGHETRLFTELNCEIVGSVSTKPEETKIECGLSTGAEIVDGKGGKCNARSFEFPLNRTGNSSTLSPAIYSRFLVSFAS